MLQIVQNGEKCKKPKKWDFQPKITKCAPFWAQKWRFSEKCRKSPETFRNAMIFQNVICCIMSQSMSRHLLCFLLYVVCLVAFLDSLPVPLFLSFGAILPKIKLKGNLVVILDPHQHFPSVSVSAL